VVVLIPGTVLHLESGFIYLAKESLLWSYSGVSNQTTSTEIVDLFLRILHIISLFDGFRLYCSVCRVLVWFLVYVSWAIVLLCCEVIWLFYFCLCVHIWSVRSQKCMAVVFKRIIPSSMFVEVIVVFHYMIGWCDRVNSK